MPDPVQLPDIKPPFGIKLVPQATPPFAPPASLSGPVDFGPAPPKPPSAMRNMLTDFGATLAVEVLFWLLDKLLGGKLSGKAKEVDADPKTMQKGADQMQATAAAVKKQTSAIEGLVGQLGGMAGSMAVTKALKGLQTQSMAATQAATQQVNVAKDVKNIADMVGEAQNIFTQKVRMYGMKVMKALTSWFGAFLALVIAGLAIKIIMVLVQRLIARIIGKSQDMKAVTGAALDQIAADQVKGMTGTAAGGTGAGPTTVGTTTPPVTTGPGQSTTPATNAGPAASATTPTVTTASVPSSPGWVPTRTGEGAGPTTGNVRVTFDPTTGRVVDFEAPGNQDYLVRVTGPDADHDGRDDVHEVFIDSGADKPA